MNLTALDAVGIASMAVMSSDASVIVLELHNPGSSSRVAQQFPSLPAEAQAGLDGTSFLHFDEPMEAIRAFERLALDSAEQGAMLEGTITLVSRPFGEDDGIETLAWEMDEDTRPVFEACRWRRETIAERI